MIGYIGEERAVNIVSYDVPLESHSGDVGTIVIDGEIEDVNGKNIRLDNGYAFKISPDSSASNGQTTLKVYDGVSTMETFTVINVTGDLEEETVLTGADINTAICFAFGWWTPLGSQSWTDGENVRDWRSNLSLASNISTIDGITACVKGGNFVNQKEEQAHDNYVTLTTWLTGLGITLKEINAEKYEELSQVSTGKWWRIKGDNIIRAIQSRGYPVRVEFTTWNEDYDTESHLVYNGQTLIAKISRTQYPSDVVFFNDGHSEVISENYSYDVIAHIYLFRSTTEGGITGNGWYSLMPNGSIVEGYRTDSVVGIDTCIGYPVGEGDEETILRPIFNGNVWAHKVEFASDKVLHLGQPVKLMLKRGELDTAINKVVIKSNDDRYFYTCGELPATAADKISANNWHYGFRAPQTAKKGSLYIS